MDPSPAHHFLGIQNLPLFILSGLLLNILPGPDTFYILGRTISQGEKAGVLSVLGISSGCLVHALAAAFGLSAILAASASAFLVVKFAGAAYLVYLGIRMLLEKTASPGQPPLHFDPQQSWTIFRQGMLTNVLNPKVALFFLSFLPQFVDPASDTKVLAFLFLGGVFIFNGTLWCLLLVRFAARLSRRVRESSRATSLLKCATGALFVALGVKLAVAK
jgi:RhtB (resistance to homoserine/threonine) family protein